MTDYNAIAATETDPDAPLRSSLFKRIVANPISAFEGDPTAVAAGVTLRLAALQRLVAGDEIRLRNDQTRSTAATSFVDAGFGSGFIQAGTVRVTFAHRHANGGANSEVRIRRQRAGSITTVNTYSTNSTGFVDRSEDVEVQPGDRLFLEHRISSGINNGEITISRIRASANTLLWPTDNFGLVENPTI